MSKPIKPETYSRKRRSRCTVKLHLEKNSRKTYTIFYRFQAITSGKLITDKYKMPDDNDNEELKTKILIYVMIEYISKINI